MEDAGGKYTVPVLWDTKTRKIVSNESADIVRMLNGPLSKLAGTDTPTPDLYPPDLVSRSAQYTPRRRHA